MPIYEFHCSDCKKDFELLCSLKTDLKTVACPDCSGKNVAKKISVFTTHGSSSNRSGSGTSSSSGCSSCSTHSCGTCHH